MTYNIHAAVGLDRRRRLDRVLAAIAGLRPQVLALQECDRQRRRSGYRDQTRELAEALGMAYHYLPTVDEGGGQYGIALLSTLPWEIVRSGPLPVLPGAEPRGAIRARIEIGDRALEVIATHLGLRAREREQQVDALLGPDWLGDARRTGPAALCGDFNALPASLAYHRLARRLRDAQAAAATPQAWRPWRRPWLPGTYLGLARIDHIWTTPGLEVRRAWVPTHWPLRLCSDHLPVVADLRVGLAPGTVRAAPHGGQQFAGRREERSETMEELTIRQAVEMAVATEEYGQRSYVQLAERFSAEPDIAAIFGRLADDEASHAAAFRRLLERPAGADPVGDPDAQAFLRAMSPARFFAADAADAALDRITTSKDALLLALDFERTTRAYYDALAEVLGPSAPLDAIRQAEKEHITVLMKVLLTDARFRGLADTWP